MLLQWTHVPDVKARKYASSSDDKDLHLKYEAIKISNVFMRNNEPIPVAAPSNT
jgi:hypothetical protein